MEYQCFRLNNGIKAIHQQTTSRVAHFGLIVDTGSRDELEHEQGMAHFIEHTIFKGTKKRKPYQIINRIEDVGGELNAYTTKEETAVYATFLNEYYERSIELIADIYKNSSFPEKELQREKEVVIEEINSYNDSPAELIFDEYEELIYKGHPIARNILGTPEHVRSFNRGMVKEFIGNNYPTDELVVCSIGNLSADAFKNLIERHFGDAPATTRKIPRKMINGYSAQYKVEKRDTYQSHCIMGNRAYELQHPNRLALVLLNNIIGGSSMNSRLNMVLRERNGMAYNVESTYTPYSDTGVFMVYFGTENENLGKAIKLVNKEFDLLRNKKIGTQQLARAKRQIIGQLAISNENHEDLMLAIGRSYLIFDKVDPMSVVFDKINAISAEQLLEVANEILDVDTLSTLIYK